MQLAGTVSTYEVRIEVALLDLVRNATVDSPSANGWSFSITAGNEELIDLKSLRLDDLEGMAPSCYTCDAGLLAHIITRTPVMLL